MQATQYRVACKQFSKKEEKRAQQKKTGEGTGQIVENYSRNLSGKLFSQ